MDTENEGYFVIDRFIHDYSQLSDAELEPVGRAQMLELALHISSRLNAIYGDSAEGAEPLRWANYILNGDDIYDY